MVSYFAYSNRVISSLIEQSLRYNHLTFCFRGPLFNDQDWLTPGYMLTYQRNMENVMAGFRNTYVRFGSGTESQQPATDDQTV